MKLLIKNTTIVTVNDEDQVLEHADLAVSGKNIVGVGKAPLDFIPDRVIDGKGKLVMPGLINAHTHLSMTLMRNYADDLPFSDWLFKKIKPLEDHLVAEDVRLGAKLGIAEMIRGGTTCFHDMYFHMDEVASEVECSGIRACLTSALFDVSG
ncbi:MAG: amidohydrolase family protein, partial [SAR324 cluster bacterium]|nr:amidohydrolase family protein [SAR324 cluster bacterium]